MLSTNAINLALLELLADDAGSIGDASAPPKVILFTNDVAPAPDLVAGDLVEATFAGYAAIASGTPPQLVAQDPSTGDLILTIKEPAGGFRWESTGAPDPVQNIFGYALVNGTKTTLFGITVFDGPIAISAAGQQVDIGSATFTLVQSPLS